jgi:hypothetical protein
MAVLLAFAALVLGGLVAGIILSTEVSGLAPRQVIGEAIEFGGSLSSPQPVGGLVEAPKREGRKASAKPDPAPRIRRSGTPCPSRATQLVL